MYLDTLPDGTGRIVEVTSDELEVLEAIREKIQIDGRAEVHVL